MLRRVALVGTYISEEHIASVIRLTVGELRTSVVTSIWSTLWRNTALMMETICSSQRSVLPRAAQRHSSVWALLLWGALSDKRTGLLFAVAAGPSQRTLSQVLSPATLMTIHCYLSFETPGLECQAPVFIFPRNRVAQLYPWALGSLFCHLLQLISAVEAF
jgi:hypothetical protein